MGVLFNKNKYYTVTEFAKIVGVSSKEIYLRLDKTEDELNKFIKVQSNAGIKLISEKAVKLYK